MTVMYSIISTLNFKTKFEGNMNFVRLQIETVA